MGLVFSNFFKPIFTVARLFIYGDITLDGFAEIGLLTLFVLLEIIAILI